MGLDERTQNFILEVAAEQANFSVLNFEIATNEASHIALASLWNAIENVYMDVDEKIRDDACDEIISCYSDTDQRALKILKRQLSKIDLLEKKKKSPAGKI